MRAWGMDLGAGFATEWLYALGQVTLTFRPQFPQLYRKGWTQWFQTALGLQPLFSQSTPI